MKKNKKNKIRKDMTFGEAISLNPKAAEIFYKKGMMCGCCPMAMMETIEQGAKLHKVNLNKLLKELNE
ncbi:MAG: DUF1858 domain-containing protein [Candidatus Pacearchaeota archaeon]